MLVGVGEGGGTDAGLDGQGVGLSGFTFGRIGDVSGGTANGLVEIGANRFRRSRSSSWKRNFGGSSDDRGSFAADVEEASLGEEDDGADQGQQN